jgi:hypothetical protein
LAAEQRLTQHDATAAERRRAATEPLWEVYAKGISDTPVKFIGRRRQTPVPMLALAVDAIAAGDQYFPFFLWEAQVTWTDLMNPATSISVVRMFAGNSIQTKRGSFGS